MGKPKYLKLNLDYVEPEDWRNEEEKEELASDEWRSKREEVLKKYDIPVNIADLNLKNGRLHTILIITKKIIL